MKKILPFVLLVLLLMPYQTYAELVNKGIYSTDDATGLDWLHLTQTTGMTWSYVDSQLGSGGLFEGWRYATGTEFETMAASLCQDPYLCSSDDFTGWSTDTNGVVEIILSQFGDIGDPGSGQDTDKIAYGILSDRPDENTRWGASLYDYPLVAQSITQDSISTYYGTATASQYATQLGTFLVRDTVGVCKGDFEPDSDVDGLDLDLFYAAYAIGDLTADLDNSGFVDINDLIIFGAKFGRIDCSYEMEKTIGSKGGMVSFQNHLGDLITLEIPPLALTESTSIFITPLAVPPANPIATNLFPGVILEPAGLIFSKPVKIRVDFRDTLANPELASLLGVKDSNLVLSIANQTKTPNSIEGEISHFSKIIGGEPTLDEIAKAILEILYRGGDTSTLGVLYTIEDYFSLMDLAQMQRVLNRPELADETENSAKGLLEERALEILSSPLPSNPCGQYSNSLMQLKNLIMSALEDTWLAEQINNKSCTLIVTPQYLYLNPGEPWELTAELFDSFGNQYSCSSIDWYSSNLYDVEITSAINNSCIVTAVSLGAANISANCDGLLGYAQVEVSGPDGMWEINNSGCDQIPTSEVTITTRGNSIIIGVCQGSLTNRDFWCSSIDGSSYASGTFTSDWNNFTSSTTIISTGCTFTSNGTRMASQMNNLAN